MLKEIFCDKFKSNNEIRKSITFEKGLNVVEGDDGGTNSIGKSTFLMCIDFVFGGNDYAEVLEDVKKNVGPHDIYFTFVFEKPYYFCRKTNEKDFVYICEPNHIITENKIDIKKYTDFLKEKYGISTKELSFRKIVSRFMRIYNRQNLNELLPLRSFDDESEKVSLNEMIKLFNLFEPIKEISRLSEEADEKKDTFAKAQEYRFLPKITATELEANKKRIKELRLQAEGLANRSERGLLELPAEKAEYAGKLKDQISILKRNRSKYYTQLNAYKNDAQYEVVGFKNDFSELTDFFDVNVRKLESIEDFHRKLSIILKKEVKDSINETWTNINALNEAIRVLEDELAQIQKGTNISKVVLKSYSSLEKEIEILQQINNYYEQRKVLDADSKAKSKSLEEITSFQIAQLVTKLNAKMEEINRNTYKNETYAPILVTPSSKKYTFSTPNDNGTGCRYKGMITLDMAILELTQLPVLTHDSVLYGQMSYLRVERTFKLYSQQEKQIFVAVDKTTNLNAETREIIDSHRRLLLSPNGNELFGWYWGKPKEDKND